MNIRLRNLELSSAILVGVLLLNLAAERYARHKFLAESSDFREISIKFYFDDALTDPRACTSTLLGALRLRPDGIYDYVNPDNQRTSGSFEPQKVRSSYGRFLSLKERLNNPKGTQVCHGTGFKVLAECQGTAWNIYSDSYRELSIEDMLNLNRGKPIGIEATENDLAGTFISEIVASVPEHERNAIAASMGAELDRCLERSVLVNTELGKAGMLKSLRLPSGT